jgi:glycosyltransferase involved in cell wall biosynthesis
MRILRIIARLNVGGPARHVTLLNAALAARGHDTLLVHGAIEPGEASLERLVRELNVPAVRCDDLGRSVRAGSDVRALSAIARLISGFRPDIVHTHTAKAGMLGRVGALAYNLTTPRRSRAVVVHTFHGHVFDGYFSPLASRLIRVTERCLAGISDRIVTISPRQRDDIVQRYRIAGLDKTRVVPLGLDLDPLLALTARSPGMRLDLDIPAGAIVIGYAGRMVQVKDLATLLDGFARAAGAVDGMYLILAGDGPERAELAARSRSLGIAERTRFIGWTDDLPKLYQTIDIFALSSINEGTPVAAIEAMAAKRPVVATSVGGVPDVVAPGETGVLVAPRDPVAFGDALTRLALDPGTRQRMGASARFVAASRYSYQRLADDVERLYQEDLIALRGGS